MTSRREVQVKDSHIEELLYSTEYPPNIANKHTKQHRLLLGDFFGVSARSYLNRTRYFVDDRYELIGVNDEVAQALANMRRKTVEQFSELLGDSCVVSGVTPYIEAKDNDGRTLFGELVRTYTYTLGTTSCPYRKTELIFCFGAYVTQKCEAKHYYVASSPFDAIQRFETDNSPGSWERKDDLQTLLYIQSLSRSAV